MKSSRLIPVLILIFSFASPISSHSQEPYLVKDINVTHSRIEADLEGQSKAVVNNKLIFIANHPVYGQELLRIAPNDSQASLHADITPGNRDTDFQSHFLAVQGRTLIIANEDLYRIEDSAQGVVLVKGDGVGFSQPIKAWFVWNNFLYFIASDSSNYSDPYGLWRTDGTSAGTVLIKNINASNYGSRFWGEVGGKLLFSTYNATYGSEPWITDGTAQGTEILKDVNSGYAGSYPSPIGLFQGNFYFVANNGANGSEIWRTNGSSAGTQLFKEVIAGSAGINQVSAGFTDSSLPGVMFFSLSLPNEGAEMWKTNGTPQGTSLLLDISPGWQDGIRTFNLEKSVAFAAGKFLFYGFPQSTVASLYTSDGTTAGTTIIHNNQPDYYYDEKLVKVGSKVFFLDYAQENYQLWRTDGTSGGTSVFMDSPAYYPNPYGGGSGFILSVFNSATGSEPWISDGVDGTPAHTHMIKDLTPGATGSGMGEIFDYAGFTYFGCDYGICRTDGTENGTSLITNFETPFTISSYPNDFITLPQKVLFRAWDGVTQSDWWSSNGSPGLVEALPFLPYGDTLKVGDKIFFDSHWLDQNDFGWQKISVSDGTEAGTSLVRDGLTAVGGESSYISLGSLGNLFLFSGGEGSGSPIGIMKSDGTSLGTTLLASGYMGGLSWNPSSSSTMTLGNLALFSMEGAGTDTGIELWKTDGTPQGTSLVKDIVPGSESSYPNIGEGQSVVTNGAVYFRTWGEDGDSLWRSDGTSDGTFNLKTFPDYNIDYVTALGSSVYVFISGYNKTSQLWKSDGTEVGTVLVQNTSESNYYFTSSRPEVFNGKIYFSGHTNAQGGELWVSDGTASGTSLFKDCRPGNQDGSVYGLYNMGGRLLFVADDGVHGFELWESNGTPEGTHLVKDIFLGAGDAFPSDSYYRSDKNFHQVGSTVLFMAMTPEFGEELWGYNVDGSYQPTPTPTPSATPTPVVTSPPEAATPTAAPVPSQLNLSSLGLSKPKLSQKKGVVTATAQSIGAPVAYVFSYYEKPKTKLPKGKKLKIKTKRSATSTASLGKYKKGVTLVVSFQVEMIGAPSNRSSGSPSASIKLK